MKQYSIKKGFFKGLLGVLTAGAGILAFSGFADFTIWQLLESYLKPVLSGLTVSGLLAMGINYLKVRSS